MYELLAGKRPFSGTTWMDVMTAILREEPEPPSSSGAVVPPELERMVAKCLEKDPADRYQDTRDLVVDLRRLRKGTDTGAERRTSEAAPIARRRGQRVLAWAIPVLNAIPIGEPADALENRQR